MIARLFAAAGLATGLTGAFAGDDELAEDAGGPV